LIEAGALEAVAFDLDGTVANTRAVYLRAYRLAFRKYLDRQMTDEQIIALFGPSEEGIIRKLLPDQWRACLHVYLAEYEAAHATVREPFAGMRRLLDSLNDRGVRLGLVTGKGPDSTAISLKYLGLDGRFEIVKTGSPLGSRKSGSLREFRETLGLAPLKIAYVGDAASDIHEAHAAGVVALAAGWDPCADPAQLFAAKPERVFLTIDELAEWFRIDQA